MTGEGKGGGRPNPFSKDDLHLLALIASQTTVAIERQQVEEALGQAQERFRTIVDSANDAVISADSQGNIIWWNKAAQRVFFCIQPKRSSDDR